MKVSPGKISEGFISASGNRKRARRNTDGEKVKPPASAQSQDPGEGMSSAAGRRVTRSELRWSGEERRAAGPRQEELKLNSSTFALTGDSSHNQAMVHWSGQNSSVSHFFRHVPLLAPLWSYAPVLRGGDVRLCLPSGARTHQPQERGTKPVPCAV